MAMTDEERQQIVNEVLAQLRADSKDFSTNQISISTDFENASEERASIKIPAFDERTNTGANADPGTISLEALLSAYGLPKVQQIASEVSSIYMKKTADSNLNMNGYKVQNISQLISNPSSASKISSITPYPTHTYEELGFTSQPDIKELTLAYIKKIATDTTKELRNGFFVTTIPSPYCLLVCDFRWTSSDVNEEGIPHSCSGFVIPMHSKGVAYKFQIYQYVYDFYQDSMFPYGDTTKDNRINAYGSNYIRYENGLQICWNTVTVSGVSIPTALASTKIIVSQNFPQQFVETPKCVPVSNGSNSIVNIGTIKANVAGIEYIYIMKDTTVTNQTISFDYVAIGKWK